MPKKIKKIKMYASTAAINEVEHIRSEGLVSIARTGGMSDFWGEIKKQGEAIRAKPAVIPRNHIWEDEKKGKKKGGNLDAIPT